MSNKNYFIKALAKRIAAEIAREIVDTSSSRTHMVVMHDVILREARMAPDGLKYVREEMFVRELSRQIGFLVTEDEYVKLIKSGRLLIPLKYAPSIVYDQTETQKIPDAPRPPFDAEFALHLLLRDEEQEALIGCLVERYGRKFERFGKRRADIWFYIEVGRTAWPLIRRFAAKTIKLAVLGEWIRRMIQ